MKITISSGKGGTGKTFIATNVAALRSAQGRDVTYIDCDVEEPNGHLFLKPEITRTEIKTLMAPVRVDPEKCIACGKCAKACHYNAIAVIKDKVLLFTELCHVCGACVIVCPEDAIVEEEREIGRLLHGKAGKVDFHYGLLQTGEGGMSPRLIRALKEHTGPDLTILDSPPGTACTAVEAVKGADVCVLVADPTPFAMHDLRLSVNMCRQIGQEPVVVVNRAGLDETPLRKYCEKFALEIVGRIPDDRRIAEVYSVGDLVIEKLPEYRPPFEALADRIEELGAAARPVRKDLIEPLFDFKEAPELTHAEARAPSSGRTDEVVIISGKGGTGKTSIAGCFAALNDGKAVISDCDVDAADLHLILEPTIRREGTFSGGVTVEILYDKCTSCGRCRDACRFEAIELTPEGKYVIDDVACEGCGVCALVCPEDAIRSEDAVNGLGRGCARLLPARAH